MASRMEPWLQTMERGLGCGPANGSDRTTLMTFTRLVVLLGFLFPFTPTPAAAQERFSFFLASTPESVERMLSLAGLRDDDVVVDLGSGDGLIPLTAARMNQKLRGWGVDIDRKLVDESNARAKAAGVSDRVRFHHRNAFDADLRDATVVTMWLFPDLMRLLRPIILERARPGTRVLTSTWNLDGWEPDAVDEGSPTVYMWIVPAQVGGAWRWDLDVAGRRIRYDALAEQHFQKVEGVVRAGNHREVLRQMTLRGTELSFTLSMTLEGLGLTTHEFRGAVRGNEIIGTVEVTPANGSPQTLPWRARRTNRSNYFASTGTDVLVPDATLP
jgi:hypothetical protein